MRSPSILLIGSGGQVGWELARSLKPLGRVLCLARPTIDLTDPDSIRGWIEFVSPDIVVNATAYTSVDQAEEDCAECHAINAVAPEIMAGAARRAGALFVHYSTDYVFDGSGQRPYKEDDKPRPLNTYGVSKLNGELAVIHSGARHLVLRVGWVYSMRRKNFFNTIRRLAGERDRLRIVDDQYGAPTWAGMIADASAAALALWIKCERKTSMEGLYHISAGGVTTWHVFAEEIVKLTTADRMMDPVVEPIPSREFPTKAERPVYSVLSTSKFQKTFALSLPYWRDSLKAMCRRDLRSHPCVQSVR